MESSLLSIQFNAFTIVLVSAFISVYYLYLWKQKSKTNNKSNTNDKKAPEPAGGWPVIGHLHLLGTNEILHRKFGAMADNNGPAFMLRLGILRAFVVNDLELAKECLTKNDRILATRPNLAAARHMGYNRAILGFAPYNSFWREMRKISTLELLSSQRLQMLKHIRIMEINTSIKELYEKFWAENRSTGDQRAVLVDMKGWFEDLTLNIMVRMISGKRHYGACEDEESSKCRKVVTDLLYLMGIFVLSDAIPLLGLLDLHGHERAMKRTFKDFDDILSRWLEEHRLKKKGSNEQHEDFMDVMLSTVTDDNPHLCDHDANTAIKSTCLALVAAGSDTTVVTLTWALSLLLNHRHVIKKAQAELDTHVGKDRQVDESDIKNLIYLQAIVKETLRLYPAAPLAVPHQAMEDCTIGGFGVPAGTCVFINIWKIQRDPNVWTDPTEFKPERFLTSTYGEIDFTGQHFELIPFGAGRRKCPGISLAAHVLHLTLARLIHEFELRTPLDAPVDMSEGLGITLPKATPLEVLLTPRLSSTVNGFEVL
uniref:CYP82C157 n=1 Tax=Corydalis yanhusuo TaxID=458692 RepID=A0AA96NEC3_9MAGN|nr:CYP82C157 [Corydalis yanhusuo]